MKTAGQLLNEKLLSYPPGYVLELTQEEVTALQLEFPDWIPTCGSDGVLRVSNLMGKPEGTEL